MIDPYKEVIIPEDIEKEIKKYQQKYSNEKKSIDIPDKIINSHGYILSKKFLGSKEVIDQLRFELTITPSNGFVENLKNKGKKKGWNKTNNKTNNKTKEIHGRFRTVKNNNFEEDFDDDLINFGLPKYNPSRVADGSFRIYRETQDTICIPKFLGKHYYGEPDVNIWDNQEFRKKCSIDVKFTPKYPLRPVQKKILQIIIPKILKFGGGILIAGCGVGKTMMATSVFCQLGLRTLFLTHTEFLGNQGITAIIENSNCRNIGYLGAGIIDVEGRDIVFCSIASLANFDKYDRKLFDNFGLIIIDEVHHMAAKTYSQFLVNYTTPYTLGLTANEERKSDGLYYIINWFIGPVLHNEPPMYIPNVHIIRLYLNDNYEYRNKIMNLKGFDNVIGGQSMITNLKHNKYRNQTIINLLYCLLCANKKVLALSGRVDMLYCINYYLEKYFPGISGVFAAPNKKNFDIVVKKRVILGGYQIAKEGLDVPDRNSLMFMDTTSDPHQAVGRVMRDPESGEQRIIIDIIDMTNNHFVKTSEARYDYYKMRRFNIYEAFVSTVPIESEIPFVRHHDMEGLKKIIALDPSVVFPLNLYSE